MIMSLEYILYFFFVPHQFKIPEMCANAVRNNVFMFEDVPDMFKTAEMC